MNIEIHKVTKITTERERLCTEEGVHFDVIRLTISSLNWAGEDIIRDVITLYPGELDAKLHFETPEKEATA